MIKRENVLKQLKKELNKKFESEPRFKRIKKEYLNKENNDKEVKIIGITGSFGKSTTAFIVHEYLKSLGYKSVLYSSLGIDSPASIVKTNEACEIPVSSESTLLSILEEVEKYEADYLIMEINESSINLVKDVPFNVRVLTNFNSKHNEEHYSPEEYKKLKKSFFENIYNDECTCVLGVGSMMTKEDYQEFMKANNCPKVTFSSQYLCKVREIDYQNIDFLLYELNDTLSGLQMDVLVNRKSKHFETKAILAHNALNFVCAMATLQALQVFDADKFNECIKNMVIPGREEVFNVNGRTIVVGLSLQPTLSNFKAYKNSLAIKKIKVLTGSTGSGFKSWKDKYKTVEFINGRHLVRKFAMEEVNKYADYVYLTTNDNAKEKALDICLELQQYLKDTPSKIIVDREEAIKTIIEESVVGDLIFISGRGNRRILCDGETTTKLFTDKEIVEKTLKELGW